MWGVSIDLYDIQEEDKMERGEQKMTKLNWTDKDENGDYVHFLIRHEMVEHGKTEEQAVAILTKYFGPEPTK